MKERIESLLSQMTVEEKVALCAGADMWHTTPIERVGIPPNLTLLRTDAWSRTASTYQE